MELAERSNSKTDFANLTVITGSITGDRCNVLVGSPGHPFAVQKMRRGDTILYDTLGEGILEVRLTSVHDGRLGFLLERVPQS